jgi:hypothetical protein
MTDELVAYLLDDLCPERRAEVERRLASDPAWQREFDRLKECFASTEDPEKCIEESTQNDGPPQDLVSRTCRCVRTIDHLKRRSPATAAFTASGALGGASRWSMADLAVAAGVLAVLGMLVLPALRESRDASRRISCQNNLQTLASGMFKFQEDHGGWLPTVAPDQPAGLYSVALAEDAGLDRRELAHLLVCPESDLADRISRGDTVLYIPSYAELAQLEGQQRANFLRTLGGIYAYRVGYRDKQGAYHQVKYTGELEQPMLTDPPQVASIGVRSGSHDGCAQNVAYQGLSTRLRYNCDLAASRDPIFLNYDGEHAAGCSEEDVVMLRGDAFPMSEASRLFQPVSLGAGR